MQARTSRCKVGNGAATARGARKLTSCTVLLQAMKEDPPLDAKCRDKFLVQSVLLPADKDVGSVATIVRMTHPSR